MLCEPCEDAGLGELRCDGYDLSSVVSFLHLEMSSLHELHVVQQPLPPISIS